ncbi:MAG TPA: ferritin-like domain-containing protein [Acidimicrobiales bacterium]|nr:ferritin-like domain-containing protein [Acidimicrobiales bacterium]
MSPPATIDLEDLGLDEGGHLLLKHALAGMAVGGQLEVCGRAPDLSVHLRAWCRRHGHEFCDALTTAAVTRRTVHGPAGVVIKSAAPDARWSGALSTGPAIADEPSPTWGLAARGATVEAGGPEFHFALDRKDEVWADAAPAIYRQAVASQWDPETAIVWDAPVDLAPEVEAAVVQVMTYLVENENAALVVPARFLGQVHPHFKEVVQVLAVQVADEARHVEVFTRRAQLRGAELGLSTAGGQASLQTLLDEPDFPVAHFLLSVLGEGTFLSLLSFIETNAPDPVTKQVTHLALADEARHAAFGMAHLDHVLEADPGLRAKLATAIRRRHDALAHTAGLNEEVFDALVILAAGAWSPDALRRGFRKVQELEADMAEGRQRRLRKLGFAPDEATELAALHTKNFM